MEPYAVFKHILGFIVIILNFLVVLSSGLILKTGARLGKKSTYLLMGNLALTEVFTMVTSEIKRSVYIDTESQRQLCIISEAVRTIPFTTNMYSVALIAFDRYLFISYGMQYEQWVYPQRARLLICLTWIWGIFIGSISVGWSRTELIPPCVLTNVIAKEYFVFVFLINAIPAVTIFISYSIILGYALKKINQLDPNVNTESQSTTTSDGNLRVTPGSVHKFEVDEENQNPTGSKWAILQFSSTVSTKKKLKAIKIVLLTTLCFIIGFIPVTLIVIYSFVCPNAKYFDFQYCIDLKFVAELPFVQIHGLLNPVIYAWWHNGFRNFFKKYYNRFFGSF